LIAIVLMLLNQQGQIVQALDAQLRPILHRTLWLGCRHRNQKADAVAVLHLIRDRKAASAMNRLTDDAEPAPEQRMRLILHDHFDDG
jgi:hypothetical protein